MHFCWCTLYVSDMEKSLDFYQNCIGLPLAQRFHSGDKDIAFLGSGETQVELICAPNEPVTQREGISLGFITDSLEDTLQAFREKGLETEGPFQPGPHTRFFYTRDPDGQKIQLVQNL